MVTSSKRLNQFAWHDFSRLQRRFVLKRSTDCVFTNNKRNCILCAQKLTGIASLIYRAETKETELEMWANAQRDGRPAEYRWRPLFKAAKFGWRPLLECREVTRPRRKTSWNLQGCPKLANRSQPLVRRSSPYYQDTCRRYCYLNVFSDCRHMLQLRRYSPTKLCDGAKMAIFASCISSELRAAHFRRAF